jgi:basic membrane protein A and related proteins
MNPGLRYVSLFLLLVLLVTAAGCTQKSSKEVPVVYILYGSGKGDHSYTDAAFRGVQDAQREMVVTVREFTPGDLETLPVLLNSTTGPKRPGLVITVGFQYADLTKTLAAQHPDIRFLAIDTSGIGSDRVQSYEITSYGDSYLSGVLAASATRSGRIGIIMGMKTELLDAFIRGYTDGARAVNRSIAVDSAYVWQDSTRGFTDPEQAGRIAERMYRNGTDVIFVGAGISNTGVTDTAKTRPGRYVIGTDSDQTHLGPSVVLASAVKRVDRVVYQGIEQYTGGTFTGGNHVAGLREGATGMVYNPAFLSYNQTVSGWESRAIAGEEEYLRSRGLQE